MSDPQASTSTSTLAQAIRAANAKINATLAMVDVDFANFLLPVQGTTTTTTLFIYNGN